MDEVNSRTKLLPADVCQAVVERIDREPKTTNLYTAHDYVTRLLGCYPNLKPHDPKAYTASLVAVFANYPPSIGKRVSDPVRGLGARLKYDPKTADVTESLEAETKRRQLIRANALWHNQERDARLKLEEAEREFEANRLNVEARKAQVAKLLADGPKPFPQDERPRAGLIDKDLLLECYDQDMAALNAKRAARG